MMKQVKIFELFGQDTYTSITMGSWKEDSGKEKLHAPVV